MPDLSARLGLPFLMPAQAQKHVTHNEALSLLDLLVQLTVQGFDALDPPGAPDEGQVWALGATPTGVWAGQGGRLAAWLDGGWLFLEPQPGWRAADATAAGGALRVFTPSGWAEVGSAPGALDNLPGVGVNTTHDAVNRLAVSSEATLLSHEGAGHQLKLNKAAPGDTASLLFQTDWSGRAEMGTAGNDDWSLKVSPDGSAWHDGLVVSQATGAVTAPNGLDAATLTQAGSPVYARNTILGTVSESGGVPTGAVIQRGSNSNGDFVRFADGTQICRHSTTVTGITVADGSVFRSEIVSWTFPAAFSDTPAVRVDSASADSEWGGAFCGSGTIAFGRLIRATTTGAVRTMSFLAVGRWF